MIINLRGTSGSGKTFVGRGLVKSFPHEEIYEPSFGRRVVAPLGYALPEGMFVLGRYRDFIGKGDNRKAVVGGGVEGMGKPEYVIKLLDHFAREYDHVFFEGLTVSASLHKYADAFDAIGCDHVVAYLDSTQQQCVDGVHTRNGGKEINETAVFEHHDTVWSTKTRFEDLGHQTMWIPRRTSFQAVLSIYADAGWTPAQEYLVDWFADGHFIDPVNQEALEFEKNRRRRAVGERKKKEASGQSSGTDLASAQALEKSDHLSPSTRALLERLGHSG